MAETTAWLLDLDSDLVAAVGEREMIHVIQSPVLFEVPQCPNYCQHVLVWQDNILPVMDIAAWLRKLPARQVCSVAGIFAYQTRPEEDVQYGALMLATTPSRTRVNDNQACALPDEPMGWQTLALSCFTAVERNIPILNLPTLFSSALLEAA
jgi:chemotaxis signal transduction protein